MLRFASILLLAASAHADMGIRPDCTETPITYEQLKRIAEDPRVTDQQRFIDRLPAGTLQTFTLTMTKLSAQASGIDDEHPGVIRLSSDGKLAIRYVCKRGPESLAYNTIEVLRFDERARRFRFTEIDFREKKEFELDRGRRAQAPSPVHEDPRSCLECHDAKSPAPTLPDPRPIWSQYDQWPGTFGEDDDRFRVNTAAGRAMLARYRRFRATKVEGPGADPCYATLPWPQPPRAPGYENYPYRATTLPREGRRERDYALRPGLKLTEIQSRLNAKRLARRLSEDPRYRPARFLMMIDALACAPGPGLDARIRAALPAYSAPTPDSERFRSRPVDDRELERHPAFDPRTRESGAARLYAVGEALGLRPRDWTLSFERDADPYYNPAIGGPTTLGHDVSVSMVVQAELMRELGREAGGEALRPYFKTYRGETETFGPKFSCIDDLNGALNLSQADRSAACRVLLARQAALEAEAIAAEPGIGPAAPDVPAASPSTLPSASFDPERAAIGQRVVEQACRVCHAGAGSLAFFADEGATRARLGREPGFIARVRARLNAGETERMPPASVYSNPLQVEHREAIEHYLIRLRSR